MYVHRFQFHNKTLPFLSTVMTNCSSSVGKTMQIEDVREFDTYEDGKALSY
jgi:hypothetical protein